VIAVWQRLVASLRRSPRLGREIVIVLLVKTLLLALLFNGLRAGPAPRHVDVGLAKEHLLGPQATADAAATAARDTHGR